MKQRLKPWLLTETLGIRWRWNCFMIVKPLWLRGDIFPADGRTYGMS